MTAKVLSSTPKCDFDRRQHIRALWATPSLYRIKHYRKTRPRDSLCFGTIMRKRQRELKLVSSQSKGTHSLKERCSKSKARLSLSRQPLSRRSSVVALRWVNRKSLLVQVRVSDCTPSGTVQRVWPRARSSLSQRQAALALGRWIQRLGFILQLPLSKLTKVLPYEFTRESSPWELPLLSKLMARLIARIRRLTNQVQG